MGLEVIKQVHRRKAEETEMRRKEVIGDVFDAVDSLARKTWADKRIE